MFRDSLVLAWGNIRGRKLRSFLTTIGIIIGVTAIIGLISVGQGLQASITDQFEKIGSNRLYVFPKSAGFGPGGLGAGLSQDDVNVLERTGQFEFVTPYYNQNAQVEYRKEKKYTNIIGIPTDKTKERLESYDVTIASGRFFVTGEKTSVILGSKAAEDGFGRELRINNNIEINGYKLKVVGILESIGTPDDDSAIYAPIDTVREMYNEPEGVSFIEGKVKPSVDINQLAIKLRRDLKRARNNENFEVQTPEQLLQSFGTVLTIVQVVLIGIAAISLLVGSIGILNSMYTSVLERTKEIGIMKSIGAGTNQILLVFLMESGIIGFTGGIVGAIFGSLLGLAMNQVTKQAGLGIINISFNPWLFVFGVVFATVVGMLAGFLPARQAAKLKPVDALREA
ncbi:MAG: ABC transporter permease [Candidatus Woesearchaeota archaeon]